MACSSTAVHVGGSRRPRRVGHIQLDQSSDRVHKIDKWSEQQSTPLINVNARAMSCIVLSSSPAFRSSAPSFRALNLSIIYEHFKR
jgi:hypothetical protein